LLSGPRQQRKETPLLANNIRFIRQLRGQSQRELAKRAGFSHAYISMIERGMRVSHDEHLDRLAAVLGVSRAVITDGDVREKLAKVVGAA
jgi:transcriptional regulator with XRE-family HTH domain